MTKQIYLDYAAATPLDPEILKLMEPFFAADFYNPSASYLAAKNVRKSLEDARIKVAHWLGSRPSEVIFTAGGTEANNLAIHGIMTQFPDANVVTSGIEHESVLLPASKYKNSKIKTAATGIIDLQDLSKKINDQTVLVSVMYANNEIGTIQPIKEIAKLITTIRTERRKNGNLLPLYLHVDACQASNYLDLHVARLGVDLMTLNGGKIYGPKQSGALYIKAGIVLEPIISGGGQERGLRSGTENVAAAIGFAEALEKAQAMRVEESMRLKTLQLEFINELESKIPEIVINGSQKLRLPNNVHITIPGTDNERLLIGLDEAGILAAAGSACSASDEEPSHVLKSIGKSDEEAQASLRFTLGRQTTGEHIKRAVSILASLV